MVEMKAYILTSEHNLYDQMGEYFVSWFDHRPTFDELKNSLIKHREQSDDDTVNHILAGGGRRMGFNYDEVWYSLKETQSDSK